MEELNLHADRGLPALVHGGRQPWRDSPQPGVARRMLERVGGEVALATSIVRYLPGSRFAAHGHERGEEFLVLEGTFSDEHGDYGPGTYVRNAPGSWHAPFSENGCVVFVKLRQMRSTETVSLRSLPADRTWLAGAVPGHQRATLFSAHGVTVGLERLDAGVAPPARSAAGGEELFVVAGSAQWLAGERPLLEAWSWLRHPGASHPGIVSPNGALLWVQRGHLE